MWDMSKSFGHLNLKFKANLGASQPPIGNWCGSRALRRFISWVVSNQRMEILAYVTSFSKMH